MKITLNSLKPKRYFKVHHKYTHMSFTDMVSITNLIDKENSLIKMN